MEEKTEKILATLSTLIGLTCLLIAVAYQIYNSYFVYPELPERMVGLKTAPITVPLILGGMSTFYGTRYYLYRKTGDETYLETPEN